MQKIKNGALAPPSTPRTSESNGPLTEPCCNSHFRLEKMRKKFQANRSVTHASSTTDIISSAAAPSRRVSKIPRFPIGVSIMQPVHGKVIMKCYEIEVVHCKNIFIRGHGRPIQASD